MFLQHARGATAIEYAMIAGLVALAVISGINLVGSEVNNEFFSKIAGSLP